VGYGNSPSIRSCVMAGITDPASGKVMDLVDAQQGAASA
jgi:hypothetical protein